MSGDRALDYGQLNAVTVEQATEQDYPCRASSGISPELDWNFTTQPPAKSANNEISTFA